MKAQNNIPPLIMVIFGGSGDLTSRKLVPALFNLFIDGYIPDEFVVVGIGRTNYGSDEKYREHLLDGVKQFSRRKENIDEAWKNFAQKIFYLEQDAQNDIAYREIKSFIDEKTNSWKEQPIEIYYLAVAPQLAAGIAQKLNDNKLCNDPKRTRMVFEKPFGHDLESARELNRLLRSMFEEDQIYRIDHYLGKETVQNILALRFANALFEPIWNCNYIDHVQITSAESIGVEDRGGYYEQAGALRDMVQNHILQLLCMIGMEAPVSFDANEIRNKKVDVLNAIRKFSREEVHANAVRGQYDSGWFKKEEAAAYREEKNVSSNSAVETFAAVKFFIDNWRWQNVPFYIRTGKRLHEKTTLITVQFKPAPNYAFPEEAADTWRPNRLTISIQPDMDIRIRFQAKRPGPSMILSPVDMIFNYAEAYHEEEPEAYETLLDDVMEGNPTLFMRADQVEAAWRIITPILEAWQHRKPVDFPNYAPGSWGPEDSEALIAKDGHHWVTLPTKNNKE
jgi:glucose-6-phosphate 1-dehydrogenase